MRKVKVCSGVTRTIQVVCVSITLLLACVPLFSQGSAGRITGTITDSNGGSVAGATVTVLDVDRGTSRSLITEETGSFNAPSLLPGNYKVRAEFKGFKATERQNIVIEVGQEVRVDLTLQPGEQAQTITVTEEIPLVETTNAELGGTIQSQVVNDLPLNGRNFQNLLSLRPGVTIYPGGSGWSNSTNGMRPHDNMYMVEGVNSNDPWMAQSIMNAVMAAGDAGTILPIDSINEFRTVENPRAEYGWKPGALVNVGIKSGTNAFHGSGYAYGRHDALDAVDDFGRRVPHHLVQYGASIGGPIKKDKLFFFGNYESQQYSISTPANHFAPDTSPTATDPLLSLVGACLAVLNHTSTTLPSGFASTVTALSAHLAGLTTTCTPTSTFPGSFPVSNGSNNLFTAIPSSNMIYSGVGKLDYHINDKNSLSGMFFMSPGDGVFDDDAAHEVDPRWITLQHARAIVGSGGWTYSPSSSVVNSLRIGYAHYYQSFLSPDHNLPASDYGFFTGITNPISFGLPRLRFSSFGSYQLGGSWPKIVGPDAVTHITDSVSYLHGNHSIKFGGEFLVNQSTNLVTNNTKGPISFADLQNYFAGSLKTATLASGDFTRNLSDRGYAAFLQDDWRVTHRLTVNAGVRYEYTTVVKDSTNGASLIGNFSPITGLEQVGVGGYNTVFNPDRNNFSPRLGFAWDIAGNGKTVVRGGAGVLYEQGSFDSLMALANNYGLRVEPTGVPTYTGGNLTPFTPVVGGTINAGIINFTGPALTGAGGLDSRWATNSAGTPLFSASPVCGDGTVTVPVGQPGAGIKAQPCIVLGVDQKLRTPYVTTWTLGIQRALTNSLSLDVSYVGNHATKLVGASDLNQPPLGAGWTAGILATCAATPTKANCTPSGSTIVAAQPFHTQFPYLSNILWLSNNNMSNYNGLQVALNQHTMHGLSYVLGYTFSHALGENSDNWRFVSPINSANPRELYGTSPFDITHRFTFAATYAIPGINAPAQLLKGWSLNSVVTLMSALPWGVNDVTTDFSGTNETSGNPLPAGSGVSSGERWDFFGNPADFKSTMALVGTNGGAHGIPYFAGTSNAACLAKSTAMGALAVASLHNLGCYVSPNGKSILVPPAYNTFGNTSPFMFRGAPFYNVDLSVTKLTKVGEHFSAQFRAEFFNIFNHPNLANPFGGPGGGPTYTDPSATAGHSFGFQPFTPDAATNPVLGSGGARAIQLGLKLMF